MPRGRTKGSKNISAYEHGKVKRIREILARNEINAFDQLRDSQILQNISIEKGERIFVSYDITRKPLVIESKKKNVKGKRILIRMEKNLAALRETL